MNIYVYMNMYALRSQKKALDNLKMELLLVTICLTWVLGTKHRTSERAVLPLATEPYLQFQPYMKLTISLNGF